MKTLVENRFHNLQHGLFCQGRKSGKRNTLCIFAENIDLASRITVATSCKRFRVGHHFSGPRKQQVSDRFQHFPSETHRPFEPCLQERHFKDRLVEPSDMTFVTVFDPHFTIFFQIISQLVINVAEACLYVFLAQILVTMS